MGFRYSLASTRVPSVSNYFRWTSLRKRYNHPSYTIGHLTQNPRQQLHKRAGRSVSMCLLGSGFQSELLSLESPTHPVLCADHDTSRATAVRQTKLPTTNKGQLWARLMWK